jgi:hypothetical protein
MHLAYFTPEEELARGGMGWVRRARAAKRAL